VLDEPRGRDLVKVLDFGLAKLFDDGSSSSSTGAVGTPRYMAPEVMTAGRSSPASDLYALGVMLGELALGGPLWSSDSLTSLVERKRNPAPLIERVPPQLRRALTALLDPDPDQRPNAAQARTLLRTVADGSIAFPPIERPPEPVPAPRRVRWPFVLVLAVAAAAGVAYWSGLLR